MLTKDKERLRVGMWLSDENGFYEVKNFDNRTAELKTIEFDDDENWKYGDYLICDKEEICRMSYVL